jgi:hypothetical protein
MKLSKTFDANLELKDAGLVASSAAATVDSAAKILDLGTGLFEGDIIIDVSACEVASDDEKYVIGAQISSSASFASDVYEVASLQLGASGTAAGDVIPGDTDMTTGRYVLRFRNQIANGTTKRYMRIYTTISGSIATGINYTAYLSKKSQ